MSDVFTQVAVGGDTARAVVRPAHAAALCAGHFPGNPLVPGAYLVGLMAAAGARLLGGGTSPPVLAEIERCAFLVPTRPDREIVIVARRATPARVEVEVQAGGVPTARATLRFGSGR